MTVLTLAREPERQILPSWIDSFLEFTSKKQSPERFRRWAAISIVAAAIERKIWIKTASGDLYPHLYILFVGLSASGKGVAMNAALDIFKKLVTKEGPHLAPTSMSAASMTDGLNNAIRKILRPVDNPSYVEFNSLYIASRELGALFPIYDTGFMSTLTDIWDGFEYRQTRRGNSIDFTIPSPQINILAATTPSHLNKFLPSGAFDEGFISRTLLIYSGGPERKSLWDDTDGDSRLLRDLINDLKIIGGKYGKLGFSEDAACAINDWYISGGEPTPTHPKLLSYAERRPTHLMKLCMIASLIRADNRFKVEMQDFLLAKAWLEDAEENMPDIFRAMSSGLSDNQVIEECHHFVYEIVTREKRMISEERLWRWLQEKVPSHNIERVIIAMVRSGRLVAHHGPTSVSYSAEGRIKR